MNDDGRRIERFTVRGWFALAAGGLVAAAAVGLVAGVLAQRQLTDVRTLLVDRLDPAVTASERLATALVDEETGVRGYALSSDAVFLEPYRRGRRDEERAFARLDALALGEDLERLRRDAGRTREAAMAWRAGFAGPTIHAVATGAPAPPETQGKRLFDGVRAALDRFQAGLVARRTAARADLEQAEDAVLVLFLAGGALLLLTVGAAAATLRAAVIAPLGRLAADVRRVAGGDFSLVLRPSGPRDVADLGRDVDAMRARIVAELGALREAESALTRQAQELQRSNAELEQFAYIASHDLQEPLRNVAGFTQMLQRRYEGRLDERAQRYIEFAVDGARRMQELISDLLAFSRVGRDPRPHGRVELPVVVERCTANLAPLIEEAGAVVEVDALPAVRGDAGLLGVVFQNLIGNAVKFRAGDRPPRVSVSAARNGADWRFSVADNGIGVEPEYAERVFAIFQRLHTRVAYEGTGIGLAMCRKIVEYHGGRIWLGPPPPGGGARFCFTLPAADSDERRG